MSTVSVTWFDSDAVWRAVRAHARALAARIAEIDEVIVFGSLVKGTAVPESDVDLLIVLSAWDRPFPERIATFLPGAFPCGVDVFPYTRAELARMAREGNPFVASALREGRTVFRREPESDRDRADTRGR